jgi:hypothetical protein
LVIFAVKRVALSAAEGASSDFCFFVSILPFGTPFTAFPDDV